MPWSTSTRAARLPRDWHARRAHTWRAAGGQCQWLTDGQRCTWRGRLNGDGGQADHINRLGGDDQANLQWLCRHHHNTKTRAEAQAAKPSRHRPAERHPGLI